MKAMSVARTETRRKSIPMVVGVMEAGLLVGRYVIPRRDPRTKTGYQREVSPTRVNRLVRDLSEKRADLPTAVLLNLREYVPGTDLSEEGESWLFHPTSGQLSVVDGQHRVEALRRLVEIDPDRWSTYEIPFVCMLGANEREEMEQFYVVNSTAKSVRTDLALDLLKQRAETDPDVMESLIERGESWKVEAQTLVEEIGLQTVWRGRIRFPGDPKGDTTIASSGMVSSLKTLLGGAFFGALSTHDRLRILDAFWKGLRNVIPEAFNEPKQFSLQKSTGVMVMHVFLMQVLEHLRSSGRSVVEPESYEQLLGPVLLELEGDTSTGEIARGVDFWRAGPEGAAGSFSSNAGRRVLAAKLKSGLPPVELE